MSSIISLSNSKKDVQAVTDPSKRAFIPRLIKSFNPLLSAHLESLKNSSSKLASFDPSTTKKESYLLFTASRFHYFEQYESEFSFGRNIYEDCFKVLGKHLHFRFAEVASQKIVSKIEALNQSSSQPVQESSETFKVLGDTGVLLELNYKVVHVRLDLQAKRRNWSYVSGEEEQKAGSSQVGINFVAIFFGILAVYLPTPLLTEKEKVGGLDVEVSKKEIEYIALKRELMKFIGVKKSSSYYLVFHKFHLLHRLKYREYSDKYLTEAAVKEGFFGSIASFFKGAAGTIANGVSKAVQTASSVVDFYQQNIKPAVDILTPIVSPLLPDNLRSLVSNQGSSKENSDFKETQPIQEAKKLARETKSSVKQCLNYLNGKRILKSFQKHLKAEEDEDNGKKMGVDVQKIRKSVQAFMGTITVERPAENGFTRNMKYSGFLFNKSTILTPKISVQENDSVRFDLKGSTYFQIEVGPPGSYSYFNFAIQDQSLRKGIDELFQEHEGLRFKLDFKEEYSSDECFYEGLINRNLFLAELVGETRPVLHMQVSKAIRCYREVFYHLFQKSEKSQGGVIFYLDEQEKSCRIISIYDKSRSEEFAKILNHQDREGSATLFGNQEGSVVTQAMKNCSSEFLNYNTYAFLQESSEQSSKEATLFVETDEAGGDDNADGESLRTQLTTNKITKSSPLELIGFIHIQNKKQNVFGVGLLIKDQNNIPLYFLTLKENVIYQGVGYVGVRKQQTNQKESDTITLLDFSETEKYQYFKITHIIPYDDFEDYVFVKIDQSPNAPKPNTPRILNTLSSSIVKKINSFGAFYVEFDLSRVKETKKIALSYRNLSEKEQASYKMEVTSNFPEKQGIFFSYKKDKPTYQSFMGFYSPKTQNKIIVPPQNIKEMKVKTMINGELVNISKLQELQGQNISHHFQSIGILSGQSSKSSASFISFDGEKKSRFILAAAHHFLEQTKDLRPQYKQIKFTGSDFLTNIYKKDFTIELKQAQLYIHPTYQDMLNDMRNQQRQPRPHYPFLQRRQVDIAVIQLKNQVNVQNPLKLDQKYASFGFEDLKNQIYKTLQDDYQEFCIAGYLEVKAKTKSWQKSQNNTDNTLQKGSLFVERVGDHKDHQADLSQKIIQPILRDQTKPGSFLLSYLISTRSGHSGAPIFNKKTLKQIGIHGGGIKKQNGQIVNYGCSLYNPLVHDFLLKVIKGQFKK